MIEELQTFIFTFFIMLIFNFIGQKIIVNSNRINMKKFFLITLIQSIIISLLFIYFL